VLDNGVARAPGKSVSNFFEILSNVPNSPVSGAKNLLKNAEFAESRHCVVQMA
jgi:hypothetical protein